MNGSTDTEERLGKYRLVRHLATGGMAEIWLAERDGPGGFHKQVVIKRILPQMSGDESFTRMFLDEARLVARLTHPHIGQIYDLGEVDGTYFIAMEYIDGLDLCELLERARERGMHLPVTHVARTVIDILDALDYAHEFAAEDGTPAEIVHRDVTPHNVIVSRDGIVKLVDFGIARAVENRNKTQTGAIKGKYAYMAPEQVRGEVLDRRVDVFATGVLLYELLTARKPFGDELGAVSAILHEQPDDPREYRPELSEILVHILGRALAKDPDERYESAGEMARDMAYYLRTAEHVGERELSLLVRDLMGLDVELERVDAAPRPAADELPPDTLAAGRNTFAPHDSGAAESIDASAPPELAPETPAPPRRVTRQEHPPPSHASHGPGAPATADPATPSPGPQNAGTRRRTSIETVDGTSSPSDSSRDTAPPQTDASQATEASSKDGPPTALLVMGFLALLMVILAIGGIAFFLMVERQRDRSGSENAAISSTDTTSTTAPGGELTTTRASDTTVAGPTTDGPAREDSTHHPEGLFHPDGLPVYLSARPEATVLREGREIGRTPVQTRLRPGRYELAFERGDVRITRTLVVRSGRPVNRMRVSMEGDD